MSPAASAPLDRLHETPEAVIRELAVGSLDNRVYLIRCRASDDVLMIDAAAESERLLAAVSDTGRLTAIVTTHRHHDHVGALTSVHDAHPETPMYAGRDDAPYLPVAPTHLLDHGDTMSVGAVRLSVVHLRGHTDGSVALVLDSAEGGVHIFSGDSLFPGGVGATGDDPARFAALLDDVTSRLFDVYPDAARIYPGHGEGTTLGAERPCLPEWRARGW